MGCTSSAPNMANSSKSEKSIQFEDGSDVQSQDTEQIIYRAGNDTEETNELPACDNLSEHNINVVRNISTSSLKTDKVNQEDRHSSEMILNKTVSSATLNEEESPPKLEEVVEKVVELHSSENLKETKPDETGEETGTGESQDNDNTNESNLQDSEAHEDEKQDTQNDVCPEEATSPSQSESSRATRWEALADIAAELPPSLTVDPVTGQIYALSK